MLPFAIVCGAKPLSPGSLCKNHDSLARFLQQGLWTDTMNPETVRRKLPKSTFENMNANVVQGSIHIYEKNCPGRPSLFCLGPGFDAQTSFASRSCESRLRPLGLRHGRFSKRLLRRRRAVLQKRSPTPGLRDSVFETRARRRLDVTDCISTHCLTAQPASSASNTERGTSKCDTSVGSPRPSNISRSAVPQEASAS